MSEAPIAARARSRPKMRPVASLLATTPQKPVAPVVALGGAVPVAASVFAGPGVAPLDFPGAAAAAPPPAGVEARKLAGTFLFVCATCTWRGFEFAGILPDAAGIVASSTLTEYVPGAGRPT